ncbi:type III secretion system chaperone [Ottowia thiooxydans]|uniref:type III secretion system chaperone n=1 Tax=Ottowia thiooxydans TaxID=219182 RepID=UPI0004030A74|nr:type III secretion system chaperone [Ottowia thiooxydans]
MTRYSALLEDYARHTGLPAQEFLASQELVFGDIAIGLAPEGDEDVGDVTFFTSLGRPSAEVDRAQLMQLMLEANGLWVGTGGCTLGLQAGTGVVLLCARLSLEVTDAASLSTALQGFATVATLWREVVLGKVKPQLQLA